MRNRTSLIAAAVSAAVLTGAFALSGTPAPSPQQTETAAGVAEGADFTLEDLRWLVGDWRGTRPDGSIVEESWREAIGESMLGTFRWVADDKVRFYEILVIEQDDTGPVLRLKHFNRGLTGWEEKDEVLAWTLVEATDTKAVFRRGEGEHTGDIVMELRGEQSDGLYIGVDITRNGEKDVLKFDFTRYEG